VTRAGVDGAATNYQPVHPRAFADFLGYLPPDRDRFTLVDLGSGRGRGVLLALEHGFGAAVGIELVPVHHHHALANLDRYERRARYAGRARFGLGDARELVLPGGPIVVFIYNPFGRDVMAGVLATIVSSLRSDPRPAWVIYEAPFHRDLLDADPTFELVGERTQRAGASPRRPRFAIYRAAGLD
jgi:hypothetical protein